MFQAQVGKHSFFALDPTAPPTGAAPFAAAANITYTPSRKSGPGRFEGYLRRMPRPVWLEPVAGA
jgi:hypothetical protein